MCVSAGESLEHLGGLLRLARGLVVVDDRRLVARDVLHELVELHADQAALAAELDAVALDLLGHPRRHLGALDDHEHVVEHDGALELERGQAREALVEALAVGLERRRAPGSCGRVRRRSRRAGSGDRGRRW